MYRILVVDDSPAALSALTSQLPSDIYRCKVATSANDAFAILNSFLPDCILCDFEMPEEDGPSFCRRLKADPRFDQIPFIILTSKSGPEHLLHAIEAGADDYLSKDSDFRIIMAKIKAMSRLKSLQDRVQTLQRVEGIKQMVATYNHEFNNPLTIAIGNLNWLIKEMPDEPYSGRLQRISVALGRMTDLVKRIRELRDYVELNYAEGENIITLKASAKETK